jgi:hypothetical protein
MEGFGINNIRTPTIRPPARSVRYVFWRLNTLTYSPDKEAGAVSLKFFGEEGSVG